MLELAYKEFKAAIHCMLLKLKENIFSQSNGSVRVTHDLSPWNFNKLNSYNTAANRTLAGLAGLPEKICTWNQLQGLQIRVKPEVTRSSARRSEEIRG